MDKKEINWIPVVFLVSYHLMLLIALPLYLMFNWPSVAMCVVAFALYFISGLSITAGYHRLYAHKAYKAHWIVELALLWFGSLAAQGSVIRWAFDHRIHHAHVDTDEDPYSINKGFWYAHVMWILKKPDPIDLKVIPDLMKNKLLQWQDRNYALAMTVTNVVTCGFFGWLFSDYLGAIVIAGMLRMFALHHSTWFINSLAHTWGWRPFCQEQSAVDNFLLSLITFGEGYHNYHHTFANDYRNGIRWYHFDPTKWLIWTLSKLGLARGLRRTDPIVVQRRLVLERKNLLLTRMEKAWQIGHEELQQKVQEISDRLLEQLNALNELRRQMAVYQEQHTGREMLNDLMNEISSAQKQFKRDWALWVALSKNILRQVQTA